MMVIRRKKYMEHFDIIAYVNGWRIELDKLKHLKAALDGRSAYQVKDLDESDPAKAFAALRKRLLSHFGSLNEVKSAVRQFRRRLQAKGEAIDEYADALLKLHCQDALFRSHFVTGHRTVCV